MRAAPRPWEEAYRRQGKLWRGERLDRLTTEFLALESEAVTLRWLDAGCGDGKGLAPLVARLGRARLYGADRAHWGLRLVRQHVPQARGRVVRADARAWPFASGSFDVVRAVHLVGHLDEQARKAAMSEFVRLLAPGGRLLLAEFAREDFRYGKGIEVEEASFRRGPGIVTHYFAAAELRALIEAAGLVVEHWMPERFEVVYGGETRVRARWGVVGRRVQPDV